MRNKKILLLILAFSLLVLPVKAQIMDSNIQSSDDWGGFIQQYDQGFNAKQVTPAEYQNAIETLQKYGKIKKDPILEQPKKKWWWPFGGEKKPEKVNLDKSKIDEILKKEKEYLKKETPSSPNPLLRLPAALVYDKTIIPDGFYLVEPVEKEDKHYIKLKQGLKTIIELEALPVPTSSSKSNFTEVVFVSSNTAKISYQNNTFKIEAIIDIFDESMLIEED